MTPITPEESADAVDATVLASLCDSLGESADEVLPVLIEDFVGDCDSAMGDIRKGVECNQADLLRRAAHSLKSLARTFGGTRLAMLSEQLEQCARTGQLDGGATLVEQIEAECPRVKAAVGQLAARPRCEAG